MKKGFIIIPEIYNLLGLSPRNRSMGLRKKRTLQRNRKNTLRNWERCTRSPRYEGVAQLFEKMLTEARKELMLATEKDPEDAQTDENGKEGIELTGNGGSEADDSNKEKRKPNVRLQRSIQESNKAKQTGRPIQPNRITPMQKKIQKTTEVGRLPPNGTRGNPGLYDKGSSLEPSNNIRGREKEALVSKIHCIIWHMPGATGVSEAGEIQLED